MSSDGGSRSTVPPFLLLDQGMAASDHFTEDAQSELVREIIRKTCIDFPPDVADWTFVLATFHCLPLRFSMLPSVGHGKSPSASNSTSLSFSFPL